MSLSKPEPLIRSSLRILLACCICCFASCGQLSDGESGGTDAEPGLAFRLALELNASTRIWEASNLFIQELSRAAPEHGIEAGEIRVDFYDRGMIGTERQLLEACFFGVVEVIQINTSVVSSVEPSYAILDLPYLFVNNAHLESVLYGEIGHEMLDKLHSQGMQGLGFYSAGFRNMFYKARGECAETPEGFGGLKIRVMESPVMVSAINALGLSATPIPFSELYQSLKTGVVDGAENSADVFVSYKYHETGCNCFTLTEHFTNQHVIIANRDWLESLEPRYRRRIHEVAQQTGPAFKLIWDEAIRNAYREMENNGVRVNPVKSKSEFIDRTLDIHQDFFLEYPHIDRLLYERIVDEGKRYLQ